MSQNSSTTLEEPASVLADDVSSFLEDLLGKARLDLEFNCVVSESVINVAINGEDADLVLGDNAQILHAINRLLSQVFYRKAPANRSIVVDCRGYRKGRILELELMAQKAAENVKHSGERFVLQPLPPGDRRAIHLALAEDAAVRTESEGTGLHRRVVILPAEQ